MGFEGSAFDGTAGFFNRQTTLPWDADVFSGLVVVAFTCYFTIIYSLLTFARSCLC